MKSYTMKNERIVIYIMIIGIFLILITPFLFTNYNGFIDLTSSDSNNIGGTIGGITAPFTGVLGSLLVYFALKEQVLANSLIQKQLDEQKESDEQSKVVTYLKQQLEIIKNDIENFRYSDYEKSTGIESNIRYGNAAINKWLHLYFSVEHHNNDKLDQFFHLKQITYLINLIDMFVKSIISENISQKDKLYLLQNIKYLFNSKIKVHFDFLELDKIKDNNLIKCEVCKGYKNGIPNDIIETINSIDRILKLQN